MLLISYKYGQQLAPSQALPRQLPQRGSQAVKFVAEVLSVMRKFSAVLLALPLGELSPQVTERANLLKKLPGSAWLSGIVFI